MSMIALTDPDLLFPSEANARSLGRALYGGVEKLPLVSPHGHTDPRWNVLRLPGVTRGRAQAARGRSACAGRRACLYARQESLSALTHGRTAPSMTDKSWTS